LICTRPGTWRHAWVIAPNGGYSRGSTRLSRLAGTSM
jgi:hypothetical protein